MIDQQSGTWVIDNDGVGCVAQASFPACGSDGETIHRDLRDRLFGAPGSWSIRQCANPQCAIGWIDPHPLPDQVIKL